MSNKIVEKSDKNGKGEYKELIDFLSVKFDKIDQHFEQVDDHFGQIETQLEKIEKGKADKSDIDKVLTRIAIVGNKTDDNRAEQIGMQKQIDKHEKWHFRTAAKIGLDLLAEK